MHKMQFIYIRKKREFKKYSLIKGSSVNGYSAKRGLPKAGPFFEGYG
jgi:hypothetical protein